MTPSRLRVGAASSLRTGAVDVPRRPAEPRSPRLRGGARALVGGGLAALLLGLAGHALGERRDAQLAVSVWSAGDAGGEGYGGPVPAAFVVQRRDVEVGAGGELRFPGVAATIDPGTAVVRSLTEPAAAVLEQRLIGDRGDPDQLLVRQVGRPVTITLARGELRGVLRAVSFAFLVVETDGPNGKTVQLVRRGEQLVDVAFPAADVATEPTLVWTLGGARAGQHTVELSYHATGLQWTPSYTAVLADDDAVDLSAWATIGNRSGLDLAGAQVTLVHPDASGAPATFKLARPIALATDRELQVELVPRRTGVRGKRVIVYEAAPDLSSGYATTPAADCYGYAPGGGKAALALELDGGGSAGAALPPGRLRVLRRSGGETVLAREQQLRVDRGTGVIRIVLGDAVDVVGERTQVSCEGDPTGRSLREEIKLNVENQGKAAVDVVLRDYLFRWKSWRIEVEDAKGVRAGPHAQEYRLRLAAGARRSVSYTVVYSW
jgi:hypothetical protein